MIRQFFEFGEGLPLLFKEQPEKSSYITIKTYLFPNLEVRCKLPFKTMITFDFCSLILISFALLFIYPVFVYVLSAAFGVVVLGAMFGARKAVLKTKKLKWYFLFPALHLIRNYSFFFGKIIGSIRYRILAI